MRRDFIVFMVGIVMLVSFLYAGIKKISPTSLCTTQSEGAPILVLDPGHGGIDGGAVSLNGAKESDINLSIVQKMESILAFCGIDSVLTRSADNSIHEPSCTSIREKKVSDLKNRASLINEIPNAMLISVHQNTFTDPKYHGAQAFFASDEYSVQWGTYTQEILRLALDPDNSRNASAVPDHVYLFKHISCPAILVECGFLSNPEESALLQSDTYQRKIATALVCAFFHQLQMIPNPLGGD